MWTTSFSRSIRRNQHCNGCCSHLGSPASFVRNQRLPYRLVDFFETIPILHITICRYQYNTNTMTSSGFNTNTNTNTSETLFAIPRPIPIPLTYFFQYQYRYVTESIEKFRFQYRNCADTDQYRTALVLSTHNLRYLRYFRL